MEITISHKPGARPICKILECEVKKPAEQTTAAQRIHQFVMNRNNYKKMVCEGVFCLVATSFAPMPIAQIIATSTFLDLATYVISPEYNDSNKSFLTTILAGCAFQGSWVPLALYSAIRL